jgi:hypothetical protein
METLGSKKEPLCSSSYLSPLLKNVQCLETTASRILSVFPSVKKEGESDTLLGLYTAVAMLPPETKTALND